MKKQAKTLIHDRSQKLISNWSVTHWIHLTAPEVLYFIFITSTTSLVQSANVLNSVIFQDQFLQACSIQTSIFIHIF